MSLLYDPLFTTDRFAELFSDRTTFQRMLDVEAALARAEAAVGVIPAGAAAAIAAHCDAAWFDLDAIGRAAGLAGNVAIPLVKALTAKVKAADAEAARFVHWGATSQDVIDTGLVLQLRAALDLLDADLLRLLDATAQLARAHRATPMMGRTWLQQALPTTFGLKVAGWHDALLRHRERLAELRPRVLVAQFGGAAGTLASLGEQGALVADRLASELGLGVAALPWHGQRDRVVEVAGFAALLTGTLGKLARDWSLLMQTEIGEVFEPAAEGKGGSSTMPHKRNPVGAAVVLHAANRAPALVAGLYAAMVQEHERGLGGWHAEWQPLAELLQLAGGALSRCCETVAGLEVDTARMRANIDITRGLVMAEAVMMALGAQLGRLAAHERVEHACKQAVAEGRHLREVLGADDFIAARLTPEQLDALFDPCGYLGSADAFVARALAQDGKRDL
ncbi:3-carboxy-cis,cis-muconate cycloisomerase [Derxia lacustris]|uniref:3-carboxy-cis,cis-muconate cycloisomerase n=1 Tax=Derxia lacustris TaxID=764842 RepID=UPI000A1784BB|nr:3-carboxy-cis,cis-muconate cycloisomerase [Derxia lacustris]